MNIFKDYQEYQKRKVDSPAYEPLGQSIPLNSITEEEIKKKRNEYAKEYYRKNKELIREKQKEYWRRKHADGNHRGDMIGIQKKVYEYLLAQYRKGEDPARGTEIAKALGVSENSVYTAVFQLTKKGYLGRGTYGRYLLLKFPNNDELITVKDIENTINVLKEKSKDNSEMVFINEQDYDGLIEMNNKLKNENRELQRKVDELRGSNIALMQERDSRISSLNSEIRDLRNSLVKKTDEFEELKDSVKILLKYFQ